MQDDVWFRLWSIPTPSELDTVRVHQRMRDDRLDGAAKSRWMCCENGRAHSCWTATLACGVQAEYWQTLSGREASEPANALTLSFSFELFGQLQVKNAVRRLQWDCGSLVPQRRGSAVRGLRQDSAFEWSARLEAQEIPDLSGWELSWLQQQLRSSHGWLVAQHRPCGNSRSTNDDGELGGTI